MKRNLKFKYCTDIFNYRRIDSKQIKIGNLELGGNSPILLQSMTDTSTSDIQATIEQGKRIFDAGAGLVRITAPSISDAKNLALIRKELNNQGYTAPLAADIHYSPNAAEMAANYVEKVRINPGNYIDKNTGNKVEFNEKEYSLELEKIHRNLRPLIQQCKQTGTAIRIGTNHGSLSNRILGRYGDTPEGMVESTMEFLRIFSQEDFHRVVLSLKSSNVRVMVYANRLLIYRMHQEGFDYPLHLGVTEAGEGEDGRIKSSIGIGTLLVDGVGDTIRVSLTETPENEIPVAQKIVSHIARRTENITGDLPVSYAFSPFEYQRRLTRAVVNIGGDNQPAIIVKTKPQQLHEINILNPAPDFIYLSFSDEKLSLKGDLNYLIDFPVWNKFYKDSKNFYPVLTSSEYLQQKPGGVILFFLKVNFHELTTSLLMEIQNDTRLVILSESQSNNWIGEQRAFVLRLLESDCSVPVVPLINKKTSEISDFQIESAIDLGPLCVDGLVDGICLHSTTGLSLRFVSATAFGILQASRLRMSKTEYISCPGCGRTLFSLQETTRKIRDRTSHLKGLKIGIMGCIVNGPGEMADADFGYVGTGPGKISLYRNKELVRKNIPESEAVDALVQLIKDNGKWVEPNS